jgi:SAM-dependent methyltransferase
VFYDLGAGLGHVAILMRLLAGVRAVGVEIESVFCETARRAAQDLGVSDVLFVQADAREIDYSTGTVFYLFTPFTGTILECVLDRLRVEGQQRALALCTYGACTRRLAEQSWLRCTSGDVTSLFSLVVWENGEEMGCY